MSAAVISLEVIDTDVVTAKLDQVLREALTFASIVVGPSGEKAAYRFRISPVEIAFDRYAEETLPDDVEQAVFFGPQGQVEVREIRPGMFRVIAFRTFRENAATGCRPGRFTSDSFFGAPKVISVVEAVEESFYLWGRYEKDLIAPDGSPTSGWQEGRIPQAQSYPIESFDRVRIEAAIYRDVETRQPLYVHWKGLVGEGERSDEVERGKR